MLDVLLFLAIVGVFAAIMGGLAWLASRLRRRGGGAALLSPIDEIFHPAAHRSRFEIQAQEERAVPMPSPDDHPGRPDDHPSRSS